MRPRLLAHSVRRFQPPLRRRFSLSGLAVYVLSLLALGLFLGAFVDLYLADREARVTMEAKP